VVAIEGREGCIPPPIPDIAHDKRARLFCRRIEGCHLRASQRAGFGIGTRRTTYPAARGGDGEGYSCPPVLSKLHRQRVPTTNTGCPASVTFSRMETTHPVPASSPSSTRSPSAICCPVVLRGRKYRCNASFDDFLALLSRAKLLPWCGGSGTRSRCSGPCWKRYSGTRLKSSTRCTWWTSGGYPRVHRCMYRIPHKITPPRCYLVWYTVSRNTFVRASTL